jgi:hypothetical protein
LHITTAETNRGGKSRCWQASKYDMAALERLQNRPCVVPPLNHPSNSKRAAAFAKLVVLMQGVRILLKLSSKKNPTVLGRAFMDMARPERFELPTT